MCRYDATTSFENSNPPAKIITSNLAPANKEQETEVKIESAPVEKAEKVASTVEPKKKEAPKAETKTEKKLENTPEKK